jgi:capsular exopolysaccharide synthesis family protein
VDLKDLVRTARRRWLTIAAFVLLALVAAGVLSSRMTPEYASHARVFISNDIQDSQDAYAASLFSAQRVKSYADLADSRGMMLQVIKDLDLKDTAEDLAGKVSASVIPDTVIIAIEVRDVSPHGARQIAQSDADNLARYLTELETPQGKTTSPIKATVVDPADLDLSQVSPHTGLNLGVAGILGLVLGLGVALLRELFDNSVTDEHDVREATPAPTMARINYDRRVSAHPMIGEHENDAARSEAFRILRTNLQFLDVDTPVKSIVVSSAVAGEGKTVTTAELAAVVAQTGQRVLVVDADLRRPRIAQLFGLTSDVGLTNALVGKIGVEDCIQRHPKTGVHVLSSGPRPPNPSEILQTKAARDLLDSLTTMFDLVLIDAPPLLPVADAAILARSASGAILVVRSGKTSRDQLRQAAQRLEAVGGHLLGVTLNMTSRRNADYGYGAAAYQD